MVQECGQRDCSDDDDSVSDSYDNDNNEAFFNVTIKQWQWGQRIQSPAHTDTHTHTQRQLVAAALLRSLVRDLHAYPVSKFEMVYCSIAQHMCVYAKRGQCNE